MKIALLVLATAGALSAMSVTAAVAGRPAQSHQPNNQNQKFNYGYDQNHQVTPHERANWQAQHAANRAAGNTNNGRKNNRGSYGNNNRGNNSSNQGNYNNRNNGNNNRGNNGDNNGNNNNGNNGNNNNGNGNPNLVNRILQQTQPNGNN